VPHIHRDRRDGLLFSGIKLRQVVLLVRLSVRPYVCLHVKNSTNALRIFKEIVYMLKFSMKYTKIRGHFGAGIAQSAQQPTTGWTVRGSNPGGGEIFSTCPDRP